MKNDAFSKISLKAFCQYEKLTDRNSMDLFKGDNHSMTDLRDIIFLIMYTKDDKTTFETVEGLSSRDFEAQMSLFKGEDKPDVKE